MSWLPMYLDRGDVEALAFWLNDQEELAFVVSTGVQSWKVVNCLDQFSDGDYQIWHIPSGPLPLLSRDPNVPDGVIADPWMGWTGRSEGDGRAEITMSYLIDDAGGVMTTEALESLKGLDPPLPFRPTKPFFGNSPGIIELKLHTRSLLHEEGEFEPIRKQWTWRRVVDEQVIGLSNFGWIGNHFRMIGHPAHPSTERWWKHLRRWVASRGEKIPRSGPLSGPRPEVYAFPLALEAIRNGMARSLNS